MQKGEESDQPVTVRHCNQASGSVAGGTRRGGGVGGKGGGERRGRREGRDGREGKGRGGDGGRGAESHLQDVNNDSRERMGSIRQTLVHLGRHASGHTLQVPPHAYTRPPKHSILIKARAFFLIP